MKRKYVNNLVVGVLCGFSIWMISIPLLGISEPWDAEGIAILFYPVSLVFAGVLSALPSPRHFLVGCVGVYFGQVLQWVLFHPGDGLWIIGAMFSLGFLLLSVIGGAVIYIIYRKRI